MGYPDRKGEEEINLDKTAFNPDGWPWISKLHCVIPSHRIEVQQGFFTVAGSVGLDHGEMIDGILDKSQYGRIVIQASMKQDILYLLSQMNINAKSPDYPGADLVGMALKRKLKCTCDHAGG